ncbi:MAG TPA: hypothetical protein DFR83_00865, partial [Deltaproteobacteria bacterium]|nr:hypothetical protein [Deltaproteobacteria bacterium]
MCRPVNTRHRGHFQRSRSLLLAAAMGLGCTGSSEPPVQRAVAVAPTNAAKSSTASPGLHWFLPDGMRADPDVFDVFQWAEEGRMPNLHALMQRGTYGWSIPTFPTHTPTNFATLLTGAPPEVHGVADGPMRVEGGPLARPSIGGFSSSARLVPAAWSLLEDTGRKVVVLSMPGSTPPELANGVTIRGRWGGWGADFPALLFENADPERQRSLGRLSRLFMLSTELTRFVTPELTAPDAPSYDKGARYSAKLDVYGHEVLAQGVDQDGNGSTDAITFRHEQAGDPGETTSTLSPGEWSAWVPATLDWKAQEVPSALRFHVVRLGDGQDFRIRILVDTLNDTVTQPAREADALRADAGPMVDFVDNFPAQLIHYPEDQSTFLQEARMSWEWHRRAVASLYERHQPGAVFHNIYTPNQMLTSRWWMGFVDPKSRRYGDVDEATRARLWS